MARLKIEDPTSQEIKYHCKKIQATWSEREKDKRAGRLRASTWVPPVIEVDQESNLGKFVDFYNHTYSETSD